jgi:type IV pilus assembly protein PilM
LALSLKKRSAAGAVGLDIDGRFLAAAELVDGRIARVASAELPAGALVDGEVVDRAALGAALKDFVSSAGLPRDVRLGISNQQIVVRMLDLPRIEDASERDAAVRFQAADAIAMPLDEAVLDYQLAGYSEGHDGSHRMQVVVVAARRAMVDEYLGAATDAGLKPLGIDLDAFAIVRALAGSETRPVVAEPEPEPEPAELPATEELAPSYPAPYAQPPEPVTAVLPPEEPVGEDHESTNASVYCHLGGVSNLAIAVGDACYFTRALSTRFDAPGAAMSLADEVRLSIDYYMAQAGALPVGDAILSGEGSRDDVLVSEINSLLTIPTRLAQPLGGLDAASVPGDDDPRRYTVAAGLALGAAA